MQLRIRKRSYSQHSSTIPVQQRTSGEKGRRRHRRRRRRWVVSAIISMADWYSSSGVGSFRCMANEIEALAKLLDAHAPDKKEEQQHNPKDISRPTPGGIGQRLANVTVAPARALIGRSTGGGGGGGGGGKDNAAAAASAPTPRPARGDDEHDEDESDDDVDDGREAPAPEFRYRQAISAADRYLGLSDAAASRAGGGSRGEEELVVVLPLPRVSAAVELQLAITRRKLRLRSPAYKLSLHLPHVVDAGRGRAKFDAKKRRLTVELPIVREDPF